MLTRLPKTGNSRISGTTRLPLSPHVYTALPFSSSWFREIFDGLQGLPQLFLGQR